MDPDAAKVFVRRNLARGAGPYRRPSLLEVNEVRIRGIEFRPFAPLPESWSTPPSTSVPGRRASFVFLECEQNHALDGRLVEIWDSAALASFGGDSLDPSDWGLAAPVLHTRYFLEDWAAELLSWVKFFFIEDLVYTNIMDFGKDSRRDGRLGGYTIFRDQFEALAAKFDRDRAEAMAFRGVMREFNKACREAGVA